MNSVSSLVPEGDPEKQIPSGDFQSSSSKSMPFSSTDNIFSSSSLKRSKKILQKRVITIPISNLEGSKQKGETTPPPDSWAWRKYGQKPIKGSPYPRGYYRCSSSKGCPARKQVERSRLDPTVLSVTYACDHNHPWPAARAPPSGGSATLLPEEEEKKPETETEIDDGEKFELDGGAMLGDSDACWFESAILPETLEMNGGELGSLQIDDCGLGVGAPAGFGEDDDFFADLDELPESSVVFRRGGVLKEGTNFG